MKRALLLTVCALAWTTFGFSQTQQPSPPKTTATIEVTATKVAEDVILVPASVTVIDRDELRARNAVDLESALTMAAGVSIAPGGGAGPARSVPDLWGPRE